MSRYTGSYKNVYKPAAAVREQKRIEAEARNAKTPPERRARYRLALEHAVNLDRMTQVAARPTRAKGPTGREARG